MVLPSLLLEAGHAQLPSVSQQSSDRPLSGLRCWERWNRQLDSCSKSVFGSSLGWFRRDSVGHSSRCRRVAFPQTYQTTFVRPPTTSLASASSVKLVEESNLTLSPLIYSDCFERTVTSLSRRSQVDFVSLSTHQPPPQLNHQNLPITYVYHLLRRYHRHRELSSFSFLSGGLFGLSPRAHPPPFFFLAVLLPFSLFI